MISFRQYFEAVGFGENIPLGIDSINLVKKKAGDGINYEIKDGDVNLGWLAGFENEYGSIPGYGEKEKMFHLYNTGMMSASADSGFVRGEVDERVRDEKYKKKGIYRTAVQKVANQYPLGLYVYNWEVSRMLRRSLAKMGTYIEIDDEDGSSGGWYKTLIIKPIIKPDGVN